MIPLRDNVANYEAPLVVWALIALNCLVFFMYGFLPEAAQSQVFAHWGAIPAIITHQEQLQQSVPSALTLFTSMFLHGGLLHLGGNMLFLYLFGDNVQERMGKVSFLVFYLVAGLIAGLAHVMSDPSSRIVSVGASG
ncbi:MAG: rhomboid family intramembrane serine protease, partial [bacterium]